MSDLSQATAKGIQLIFLTWSVMRRSEKSRLTGTASSYNKPQSFSGVGIRAIIDGCRLDVGRSCRSNRFVDEYEGHAQCDVEDGACSRIQVVIMQWIRDNLTKKT